MILKMYTDLLLNELKTNRKINLARYSEPKPFVRTLVNNYDLELYNLNREVNYPILDNTVSSKGSSVKQWEIDYNNCVKLHKEFVLKYNIPLNILLDERFITYLTHDIYYEFNIVRWPATNIKRVESKYLVPSGAQGFTRNLFMRFFWYAYVTYDKDAEDPYELTKIAFEYQDPVNQIMERKYSKNKQITKAALKAIKLVGSNELKKKRSLFGKYINNMLSLYALDTMNESQLIDLFVNVISQIVNSDVEDDSPVEEE